VRLKFNRLALCVGVAALAVPVAACGDDESSGGGGGGGGEKKAGSVAVLLPDSK
jgi:D-xylose transport system substrate-binding protein